MRRSTLTAVGSLVLLAGAAFVAPTVAHGDLPTIPTGIPTTIPTSMPTSMPTSVPTDLPNVPNVPNIPGADTSAFALPPCPASLADLPPTIGTVTGTVQTPSGAYALAGANVKLVNASGVTAGQTVTDGCGRFRMDGVAPGKYKLEYGVRTFKGSSPVDVTVSGNKVIVKVDPNFLKIGVFQGEWDHIEKILDKVGVSYTKFPARTVAKQNLDKFNILFINCGAIEDGQVTDAEAKKLRAFVDGGGALYVSDRSVPYITAAFPESLNVQGNIGPASMRKGNVIDVQLGGFLRGSVGVPLNYNLGAWRRLQKVQPVTTLSLLRDSEFQEPSIVTFLHGAGFVGYTTFHDEAQMNDGMTYSLVFFITRM